MALSNLQQLSVLLWSLLFGVCLGVVYDCLRGFRIFVPCPAVVVGFQDLLYFLFAAIASFLFIFEVNDGTVRLFILLAFFFGGLAQRFTLGALFCFLCRRLHTHLSQRPQKPGKPHTRHKHLHHPTGKAEE